MNSLVRRMKAVEARLASGNGGVRVVKYAQGTDPVEEAVAPRSALAELREHAMKRRKQYQGLQ